MRDKLISLVLLVLLLIVIYRNATAGHTQPTGKAQAIEHHIDTLIQKYAIHDTLEKVLRVHASQLVIHDTIHDTLRAEAIQELDTALDECDSSKALRDSVITKLDTVVKIEGTKPSTNIEGYGIAALIGILIGGFAALFLIH